MVANKRNYKLKLTQLLNQPNSNSLLLVIGILNVLLYCYMFLYFCSFGFIDLPVDELGQDLLNFPTRQTLVDFLIIDTTDENPFSTHYDCKDYATDLKRNARNLGYRIRIYPVIGKQLDVYEALMKQYFNRTSSSSELGHVVCKAYIVDEERWVTIEPQGDWILNCTIQTR